MKDYKKIAIELGQTLISKAPETREDVERMLPELKESEDERKRKDIVTYLQQSANSATLRVNAQKFNKWIAWLEEQANHANFRNGIKIGDKVTRNKDGVLVNLSQLNRVAKKQGEQKPDIVEPKFKAGDIIRLKDGDGLEWTVEEVFNNGYYTIVCADRDDFILLDDKWELVEQKSVDTVEPKFKAGDRVIGIVSGIQYYITEVRDDYYCTESGCIIMFNAQDNFELSKQKPAWNEKDETMIEIIINDIVAIKERTYCKNVCDEEINWLKSLKDRIQPKQEWSEEDENVLEDIEEAIINYWHGDTQDILLNRLKSLRPPYYCDNCKLKKSIQGWKPSDEQIKAVKEAACYSSVFSEKTIDNLISLSKQLNKLREEQL